MFCFTSTSSKLPSAFNRSKRMNMCCWSLRINGRSGNLQEFPNEMPQESPPAWPQVLAGERWGGGKGYPSWSWLGRGEGYHCPGHGQKGGEGVLAPDWGNPSPPASPSPSPEEDLGPEVGIPLPRVRTWDQRLEEGPGTRGWRKDLGPETGVLHLCGLTNKLKILPCPILRGRVVTLHGNGFQALEWNDVKMPDYDWHYDTEFV